MITDPYKYIELHRINPVLESMLAEGQNYVIDLLSSEQYEELVNLITDTIVRKSNLISDSDFRQKDNRKDNS